MKADRQYYYDQSGNEIHEGDLLKVFHFKTRHKIYYMYHVAIRQDVDGVLWWSGKDYNRHDGKGHYWFLATANKETGIMQGVQIINRAKWDENFKTKRISK